MAMFFDHKAPFLSSHKVEPLRPVGKHDFWVLSETEAEKDVALFLSLLMGGSCVGIAPKSLIAALPKEFGIVKKTERCTRVCADFLTFSGGSTGLPKIIRRDAASWITHFGVLGTHTKDHVVILGRLSHSLALFGALEATHLGAECTFLGQTRIGHWVSHLLRSNGTVLYATPTQLRALRTKPIESFRLVCIGGGAVSSTDRARLKMQFPNAQIKTFYGSAETSFIAISDDETPPDCIGKTSPSTDLKIDEEGFIWVKGPGLFKGYAIPARFPVELQDGWVRTGELGKLSNGYLSLLGRKDRQIQVNDKSVHLDELEEQLLAHKDIKHAAAISVPDEMRGARIETIIQLHEPTGSPEEFPGDWPLTEAGKTDYTAIKKYVEMRRTSK